MDIYIYIVFVIFCLLSFNNVAGWLAISFKDTHNDFVVCFFVLFVFFC